MITKNIKNDKISIIIPVYNREKYIKHCLDSALSQNIDKEIIVVDDGSTDSSLSIIKEYEKANNEIIVFHQENGGLSKARNRALKNAHGDYIFFLDSDDCLEDGALLAMLGAAKENQADMVIGNFRETDNSNNTVKEYQIPKYAQNHLLTEDLFWRLNSEDSTYVGTVVWGRLYKREVWNNLLFPEGVIHEDEFMQHLIVQKAKRIFVINTIVETINLSPGSIMRSSFGRKNLALAKARAIRTRYLISKGYYNYALYNFGFGTRTMIIGHNELSDEESKKEIALLYDEFKKLANKLSPYVNMQNKIRLCLFRANLDVYGKVRALLRP